MRVAFIALGSRGDVQPYIALGKGLHRVGHRVRLVTHENYERLVNAHGLEFWPVSGNVQEIVESEDMRALLDKGDFLAITARTAKEAQRAALVWAREGLAGCEGMDVLLAGIGGLFVGLALAEKLSVPLIQAHVIPFTPTAAFPGALLPPAFPKLGGAVNRLSHHLTRQMMWQGYRSADALARQQALGLPAAPFFGPYASEHLRRLPILYGFSPSVIQPPGDWPEKTHVTGYWFLDSEEDWTPLAALEEFLSNGPPPVCIGFGSMSHRKPKETADLIVRALALSGQRGIVLSGWDGFRQTDWPDSVFSIESIPHAWLFPRVAAVAHHGGAGTTAAGLRAGVPSIVIPFFGDQPFWGQRVKDLGVGPEPIARQTLTAEKLAHAVQQAVTDSALRQRAAALGVKIQSEDGIGRAVTVIETITR